MKWEWDERGTLREVKLPSVITGVSQARALAPSGGEGFEEASWLSRRKPG